MPKPTNNDPESTRVVGTDSLPTSDADSTAVSPVEQGTRTYDGSRIPSPPAGAPVISGYAITGEIARGGMGCVYAGRELRLDREVAIKTLLSQANVARFVRESKITAQLPHPGIPPVYAMGTLLDGSPYLAMKFVRGQTLANQLDERPEPASELPRFLQSFEAICQAVGFAHSRGIIHRDLKPANVMVGAFGEVQVMDWGLAKELADADEDEGGGHANEADGMKTQAGAIMGTPAYMAPEQARGVPVDARADVFALGAILAKILTGHVVFQGKSAVDIIRLAASGDTAKTFERLDACGADDELIHIAKTCLNANPAKRYATARELAETMANYRSGVEERLRRAETERAEAAAREVEHGKRRRAMKWAGGVIVAVLLAGVGVSSYFAYAENKRAESEADAKQKADTKTAEAVEAARRESEQKTLADVAADVAKTAAKRAEDQAELAKAQTKVAVTQTQLAEAQTQLAEGRLETSDLIAHAGKLTLAQYAFAEKNLPLALGYLDGCQWHLRGWEHRHLRNLFDGGKPFTILKGHAQAVDGVAVSLDGKRIVTASSDKTLKVWDAESGTEIRTLRGHTDRVLCVAFSPDGKRIVSGSFDRTAKVWDANKGTELFQLPGHKEIVTGVVFSPDGQRIVTGGADKIVRLWDADKGTVIFTLPEQPEAVNRIAFSPDGRRILTGSSGPRDATATVWDAGKGTPIVKLQGHVLGVGGLAFSPDGRHIATGGYDKLAKVWDAETGAQLVTLRGHTESLSGVAYSPDGKRIVTSSFDKTVKVWDAERGVELLALKAESPVYNLAFSSDGKRVVGGLGDGTAKVWHAEQGTEILALRGHFGFVNSVAFHPDGRRVVTGSMDRTARVWDFEKGVELLSLNGHTDEVTFVAYSSDGKRIATGSDDKTVRVWDAEKGTQLFAIQYKAGDFEEESTLAFSPDGKQILSLEQRKTAKVWDVEKGTVLATFENTNLSSMRVAFSPDGKRIFGQGRFDEDMVVLSAEDGKPATGKDAVDSWRAWARSVGPFEEQEPRKFMKGPAISPNGRFTVKPVDFTKIKPGNSEEYSAIVTLARPPKDGTPWPYRNGMGMRYHHERAALAEKEGKHFAAAFHLGRILIDDPDNADLKKRRETALNQLMR